jgi:ribosomal protein L44E
VECRSAKEATLVRSPFVSSISGISVLFPQRQSTAKVPSSHGALFPNWKVATAPCDNENRIHRRNSSSTRTLRSPVRSSERNKKMPDTIALVCAGCGTTVMRHPAMRLRRVVCLACVQKAKNEVKRNRREKRLSEQRLIAEPAS